MAVDTKPTPGAKESPPADYCHLTCVREGWELGRPLCGADAPRCNPTGKVIHYQGKTHCPRCGKPICPTCRSMEPGK